MAFREDIDYNQILRKKENQKKEFVPRKFGARQVEFDRFLPSPAGYESIFYTLYFIAIPYIVGITFLFFYVAHGAYNNFALLELNAFLIIWAIGYEVTAILLLTSIFLLYVKFLRDNTKYMKLRG